ncbi:MAG: S8 family serine peptidase [Micrococcales bacterium]|nr:S8 family serine peptidase [Micrococcales bacterium]
MDLDAYVAAHQAQWNRLETLVAQRRHTGAEADELLDLYQRVSTHLSVVRSASPDPALVAHLSSLVARARFATARRRGGSWRTVLTFFTATFPAGLYRLRWWWVSTALANVALAFVVGWYAYLHPRVWTSLMTPQQIHQFVDTDFESYYSECAHLDFTGLVWTNNAWVAAQVIAMGIFGLPVLFVLANNVVNVGVAGALMAYHDRTALFFGLILPHGLLELTAVFVAGAVGLRIFWAWLSPGPLPRGRSLAHEARTGTGVVVASLDSGVGLANPDLAASYRGGTNSWFDPYGQHAAGPVDLTGHGSAVMGVMVGDVDAQSPYGMAPGARWIAARIYDDAGNATLSAIHQAFQWVLDPDHDPTTDDAPDVVNLSWALGTGAGCDLSVQPDLAALRAAGILPVAAAGNFGPAAGSSASPANYPEALSVGAVTATNTQWMFSSSGPSTCGGRSRVFPDLVAPGVNVLATDQYGSYSYVDGTSVAAPHVSGAAALLLQGRPTLTPDALAAALTSTAQDLGTAGPDDVFGAGLVDVAAADATLGTVVVPVGDFRLRADPSRLLVVPWRTAGTRLRIIPSGGFTATTTLTLEGLAPTEARWWFTPEQVGPGRWASSLRIQALSGLAPGQHRLTVRATGGGRDHTVAVTLLVVRAPRAPLR